MEVNKKNFSYDAPQVEVMELYVEGVLCGSNETGTEGDGEINWGGTN